MGIFGRYPKWGRAHSIQVRYLEEFPGISRAYFGGADPRRIGEALGY